jgi:hypothetical protein
MKGTFRESARRIPAGRDQSLKGRFAHNAFVMIKLSLSRLADSPHGIQMAVVCVGGVLCTAAATSAVGWSRGLIRRDMNPLHALAREGETPDETQYRLDSQDPQR